LLLALHKKAELEQFPDPK